MTDIVIKYHNSSFIKIFSDESIAREISDHFSFTIESFEHIKKKNPQKYKHWDGRIRLFNRHTRLIPYGLLNDVKKFAESKDLTFEVHEDDIAEFATTSFSLKEAEDFIETLNLPPDRKVREYQLKGFVTAIRDKRALFLSPTSSGKSLLIYLIIRYLLDIEHYSKILLIVPSIVLVHQMVDDFVSYGWEEDKVHKLYEGQQKVTEKQLVVSTWQSINSVITNAKKQKKNSYEWLQEFDCVIGDEAHGAEAAVLTEILSNSTASAKIGFTGTLKGTQINELAITGLFGPIHILTTIKEMEKNKQITKTFIKSIILNYPDEHKKFIHRKSYPDELDYLTKNEKRNKFIMNLALSVKGTTIIFFRFLDHGKTLRKLFEKNTNRPLYYSSGEVDGEDRNADRKEIEGQKDVIWLSSVVGATGVNVTSIHNIIFTHPSKGRIKILQSLGRGMRLNEFKNKLTAFDIADNLVYKEYKNHTYRHFEDRIKLYNAEEFEYKLYNVNLYS